MGIIALWHLAVDVFVNWKTEKGKLAWFHDAFMDSRGLSAFGAVCCRPWAAFDHTPSSVRQEVEILVMQWPKWWSSSTKDEADSNESATSQATKAWDSIGDKVTEARESVERNAATALPAQVKAFAEPQTIVATAVLTASCLGLFKFYKSYLRRIPQATNITPGFLRRRSLVGRVTSVGDGDNFRFYHTPGGRLAGWGWFPGRRVPTEKKELKDQTVHEQNSHLRGPSTDVSPGSPTSSWSRCTRARSLWQAFTAICAGGSRLAHCVRPRPPRSRLRLQNRPVQ